MPGNQKAKGTFSRTGLASSQTEWGAALGREVVIDEKPRKLTVIFVVSFSLFLLISACSIVGGTLLLPLIVEASGDRKQQVIQQMEQIGAAINAYRGSYGHSPALHTVDQGGQAACSWRVLITPFLPDAGFSDLPHPSQAWDSPANTKLGLQIPPVFVSPLVTDPPTTTETHIFALTQPQGAISESGSEMKAAHLVNVFRDHAIGNRIFAAYLPNHTAHWAAPVDITLKRLQDEVSNATLDSPVILLFTDGRIVVVESPLKPFVVKEMVTGVSDSLGRAK